MHEVPSSPAHAEQGLSVQARVPAGLRATLQRLPVVYHNAGNACACHCRYDLAKKNGGGGEVVAQPHSHHHRRTITRP